MAMQVIAKDCEDEFMQALLEIVLISMLGIDENRPVAVKRPFLGMNLSWCIAKFRMLNLAKI